MIIDNWDNFFKAFWSRSGVVDNVPEETLNKLIRGMSSAGDMRNLDAEIERISRFAATGLTELSIRLFDNPMDGLKLIGKHVLPAVH